jgi:hypothetical protein
MSTFDIAEGRILIALFIAHHGEKREILTWEDIEARYHTKVSKLQFEAIVGELEQTGVIKVFRDKDGSGVLLLDHSVRFAYDKIVRFLNADTFEVNWKAERILTDAPEGTDVPCPNGWMLMHTAKAGKQDLECPMTAEPARAHKHGVSAGRDMLINVGSPDALLSTNPHRIREPESWWVKWQTLLTGAGVILAAAAIVVTIWVAK